MTVTDPAVSAAVPRSDLVAVSRSIADEVAAEVAVEVDRLGRFPSETIEACSEAGILGALVPEPLGGMGASITEVGRSVSAIGRHCASSAMVLAMHHLQVACLARHGRTGALRRYLAEVADLQLLLASATTEINIGGQLRTSACSVVPTSTGFSLEKEAPVISYGAYADAILVTARRSPESTEGDQVLVVCPASSTKLEQRGEWDALGMRGTCSSGFHLTASGTTDHVLTDPFGDIAEHTMLPVSHILWGYVWTGIAAAAVSRARRSVQAEARKRPGTTPASATRLAELMVAFRSMEATVDAAARRFDRTPTSQGTGISGSIAYNGVKVAASQAVVEIVTGAMAVCGIAGYRNDTPFSVGRQLRDAHGSVVMVNNQRILGDNAHLLLVDKEEI